jgi:GcrA cell cycle regulator
MWTPERVERLEKLWDEGLSANEIANDLKCGFTRSAVIGKIHRLGLKRDREVGINNIRRLTPRPAGHVRPKAPRGRRQVILPVNIVAKTRNRNRDFAERSQPATVQLADVSNAKPWLERKLGECAFIVEGTGADAISCCNKAEPHGYCAGHAAVMFVAPPTPAKKLERMARRYAA